MCIDTKLLLVLKRRKYYHWEHDTMYHTVLLLYHGWEYRYMLIIKLVIQSLIGIAFHNHLKCHSFSLQGVPCPLNNIEYFRWYRFFK